MDNKTITIDMNDDPDPEVNESFLLSLTSPTGGAVLAASAATTFIQNADGPGVLSFNPFLNPMSGTEGESNIQVVVGRLNGSEGEVSVSYDIIEGKCYAWRGLRHFRDTCLGGRRHRAEIH